MPARTPSLRSDAPRAMDRFIVGGGCAHMSDRHTGNGVASIRGVMYLTAAKAYFILAGYAVYFFLTRLLTKEQFGSYALVTGVVAVLNSVLIAGTIQAVSRFVSAHPADAEAVRRAALRLQLLVGGGLFAAYASCSPMIARFLHDPTLLPALRLSSLVLISYAFYAVYVGYVNGRKEFSKQASLDATFSTLKLLLVTGLAYAGLGVEGAVGGFGMAAFLVLVIAMASVGRSHAGGCARIGELAHFQFFMIVFTLVTNLLLKTDLFLLKRLSPAGISNACVAYYAAAQALAFVPYQAIISITLVLFPSISRLDALAERESAREYVRQVIRYSLLITLFIAAIFSSCSEGTLALLFPGSYVEGAAPLSLLVFGMVFFAVFMVGATIVSSSGRPVISAAIAAATLLLDYALNSWLIPPYGMRGAAAATTCAAFIGLCGVGACLRFQLGYGLPLASLARIGAASALVYCASSLCPVGGLLLIGKFAVLGLAYLAVLFALREVGMADLARFGRVLGLPGSNPHP